MLLIRMNDGVDFLEDSDEIKNISIATTELSRNPKLYTANPCFWNERGVAVNDGMRTCHSGLQTANSVSR